MKILPLTINFKAKKMPLLQAKYIKHELEKSEHVDIICHELTDRDSLNSAILMQDYLSSKDIKSRIILSQNLDKLGSKSNYNYIQTDELKPDEKAQTVLCVDFSRKERISPNMLKYIESADKVLCIDHHAKPNIIKKSMALYTDTSAKSATSVIYRFFEANKEEIDSSKAYRVMLGLVDDGLKKGLFVCDSKVGKITPTSLLKQDKNAYQVFLKTYSKLNQEQIDVIAGKIDIMANLNPAEKRFKDFLYSKLQFSENGKIAYVEIPPDDKEWKELGGDNARTSTILNRFRQDVIQNKFQDEKLDNVELAIVFYEADDRYRISAHSKNSTLLDFYDYVEKTKIPEFTKNAGGHKDRGGGKIFTTNPEICHKWAEDIISCADFYDNTDASLHK